MVVIFYNITVFIVLSNQCILGGHTAVEKVSFRLCAPVGHMNNISVVGMLALRNSSLKWCHFLLNPPGYG